MPTKPPALDDLLDVLACPRCGGPDLRREAAAPEEEARWRSLIGPVFEAEGRLTCGACGAVYPLAAPGIPVLWSDALRESFERGEVGDLAHASEQDVKAANLRYYEAAIGDYEAAGIHSDPCTTARFGSALEAVGVDRGGVHLDVGCGPGNVLDLVAWRGPQVGMDISLSALRIARKRGYGAVLGDAERLPFRPGAVALVTASSVLHHLFEPARLLASAHAALAPGGVLLTDFDPSWRAAQWGPLVRGLYALRRPVYRLLARGKRRVAHRDQQLQAWNEVAEFHNRPGAGFKAEELRRQLEALGFRVGVLMLHNTTDREVTGARRAKPSPRHVLTQALSLRNPWLRKNADTIMTTSVKPGV